MNRVQNWSIAKKCRTRDNVCNHPWMERGESVCVSVQYVHTSLTTKLGYLTLSSRGLEKIRVCVRQGSNKCTWMFT